MDVKPAKIEQAATMPASKPCPSCGGATDGLQRCWLCCDRGCEKGRQTGSAFITKCILCQAAAERGNS